MFLWVFMGMGTEGDTRSKRRGIRWAVKLLFLFEKRARTCRFPSVWLCKVCFSHVTNILCSNVLFFSLLALQDFN